MPVYERSRVVINDGYLNSNKIAPNVYKIYIFNGVDPKKEKAETDEIQDDVNEQNDAPKNQEKQSDKVNQKVDQPKNLDKNVPVDTKQQEVPKSAVNNNLKKEPVLNNVNDQQQIANQQGPQPLLPRNQPNQQQPLNPYLSNQNLQTQQNSLVNQLPFGTLNSPAVQNNTLLVNPNQPPNAQLQRPAGPALNGVQQQPPFPLANFRQPVNTEIRQPPKPNHQNSPFNVQPPVKNLNQPSQPLNNPLQSTVAPVQNAGQTVNSEINHQFITQLKPNHQNNNVSLNLQSTIKNPVSLNAPQQASVVPVQNAGQQLRPLVKRLHVAPPKPNNQPNQQFNPQLPIKNSVPVQNGQPDKLDSNLPKVTRPVNPNQQSVQNIPTQFNNQKPTSLPPLQQPTGLTPAEKINLSILKIKEITHQVSQILTPPTYTPQQQVYPVVNQQQTSQNQSFSNYQMFFGNQTFVQHHVPNAANNLIPSPSLPALPPQHSYTKKSVSNF